MPNFASIGRVDLVSNQIFPKRFLPNLFESIGVKIENSTAKSSLSSAATLSSVRLLASAQPSSRKPRRIAAGNIVKCCRNVHCFPFYSVTFKNMWCVNSSEIKFIVTSTITTVNMSEIMSTSTTFINM